MISDDSYINKLGGCLVQMLMVRAHVLIGFTFSEVESCLFLDGETRCVTDYDKEFPSQIQRSILKLEIIQLCFIIKPMTRLSVTS